MPSPHLVKDVMLPRREWYDPVQDAPLDVQVGVIKDEIAVSTNSSDIVLEGLALNPQNLRGKRVLDIASGLSTFVKVMADQGVDIRGVDTCYTDLDTAFRRGESHDARGTYRLAGASEAQLSPSDRARLQERIDYLTNGSRLDCIADIKQHPDRYVPGSALDLPFPNQDFDMVTCFKFLTSEPGMSEAFTFAVVKEAVRVLAKSGELRIGDFNPKGDTTAAIKEANIRSALKEAQEQKIIDKIAKIGTGNGYHALVITRSRKR